MASNASVATSGTKAACWGSPQTRIFGPTWPEVSASLCSLLKYGAHFVFSMSHPMATAWDGQYDRYTRTESGERLYANISNYMVEGKRTVKWVVEDYEVYHRTFSSIVNSIVNAGFLIEECEESHVSDEMRKQYPALFGGTLHRPDFIFFRCKKQS